MPAVDLVAPVPVGSEPHAPEPLPPFSPPPDRSATNLPATSGPSHDAGQATPFVVLLVVVALAAVVLLARLGGLAVDRAEARTAADAAAMAVILDGESAARAAADANGGVVESVTWFGPEVEVTVRVGGARATSRARTG